METIELSRNNWIFIILAAMLFTFISCTKEDLASQEEINAELMHIENPENQHRPTEINR